MSEWKTKRFWDKAEPQQVEGGYSVTLDGRAIKTPAKAALILPSMLMARAVAAEWDQQGEELDPRSMPVTRSANAAIDKVSTQFDEVAELIAAYGGSDLLCYRAEAPEGLIARQQEGWDPMLQRAADELKAPLNVTHGIVPVQQPQASLDALSEIVRGQTVFQLAGLHDLVSLTGSLVLGLAAARGWAGLDQLWALSRIDETWQQEQWGVDEEAAELAAAKCAEFEHAARFHHLADPAAHAA